MAALQEKGLATSYKEKLKHCIIKIVKVRTISAIVCKEGHISNQKICD